MCRARHAPGTRPFTDGEAVHGGLLAVIPPRVGTTQVWAGPLFGAGIRRGTRRRTRAGARSVMERRCALAFGR